MKDRIHRHLESMGLQINIDDMFIGTIHSFCLDVLKRSSDEYKNIKILDTVKEHLFISKYNSDCGASTLGLEKKLDDAALFSECIDKMIYYSRRVDEWPDKARQAFFEYRNKLKKEGFINFSFLIYELLNSIDSSKEIENRLRSIKHLVVDEYQDVDDLQELLIEKINSYGAMVCVVGDDDQTIYQFRGSNAENIITFSSRYNDVVTKELDINYRSDYSIIDVANTVIRNNKNRIPKMMETNSQERGIVDGYVATSEEDEYLRIANDIIGAHNRGIDFADIAVLIRKRSKLQSLIKAFDKYGIPYQTDITDDFFSSPYYNYFCSIFDYLTEGTDEAKAEFINIWSSLVEKRKFKNAFRRISRSNERNERFSDLFRDFINLTELFDDINNSYVEAFVKILDDFDSIYENDSWFVRTDNLKYFINREGGAKNEYKYSKLIEQETKDAITIMTIHKSKGLEYDVVFLPDLQQGFFPSNRIGGKKYYKVLGGIFEETKEKYETSLEDERKLFYVAVTRAKRELHLYSNIAKKGLSIFLEEAMKSEYLDINIPQECFYDIEAIKNAIIEDLYAAAFVGHFGAAFLDIEDIKKASDEEVLSIAGKSGIDIEKYLKVE